MKKLTLIIAAVVIVLATGLATYAIIKRYDASQSAKRAEAAKVAASQQETTAKAVAALQADKATLTTQYNQLHAQCLKGKAAYDLLTPAVKAKTDAPACGETR